MGYPELWHALEDEARREARAIAEKAADDARALLDQAGRDAERARAAARAAAGHDADWARQRAGAEHDTLDERDLLCEARAVLAELRAAVAARLPGCVDAALVARLVDELLPDLEGPDWELRVPEAAVAAIRERVGARARVVGAPLDGAVAARGPISLDNTLGSRLDRAFAGLEPELARLLFGEPR